MLIAYAVHIYHILSKRHTKVRLVLGRALLYFTRLRHCVQPDRKVLVTCARNQAVDAITDKLIPLNPLVSALSM
jgi:hypothetical protein